MNELTYGFGYAESNVRDSPNEMDSDTTTLVGSEDKPAAEAPLANDFAAMAKYVLPDLHPEQKPLAETHFTWKIENWRSMSKKERSPKFECADAPWQILFFPFGNNVDFTSFYLEHGFTDKPPQGWYACVQFAIVLWNPRDPSIYTYQEANHRFTPEEGDWGFTRFVELRRLMGIVWERTSRPLVEADSANVTAYLKVIKDPTGVLWHSFQNYNSKKETGLVGLRNHGATCYLNSLLQSLYFTNAFRKAVYQIPTQNEETPLNSAYTLQRLFYLLQTESDAVQTTELTRSFGWEQKQIFEQQDVQELSRKLMERMEEKMKGTEAENSLAQLFVGKTKTYIDCINVDYESSRIEDFWDIQLNVSGNKNLDESFKDYIQVEVMDGENKYFAEGFGLQDANKGVIFESFPQVLHLQLKRFEYDVMNDSMTKINDRYEFPETFDAAPYLSKDADKTEPYIYQLHGVLVHSGDVNAGHYYAFLKPEKDGWFFKFDDERVTKATMKEVLDENFGGEYDIPNGHIGIRNPYTRTLSTKRSMSAYMLVYIRQSRIDNILLDVSADHLSPHIRKKFEEERALQRQRLKERQEQHLYMAVRVVTEETYKMHTGCDLTTWDAIIAKDPAAPRYYRILKSKKLSEFVEQIAADLGENPAHLRLWCMVHRQNKTIRADAPIPFEPDLTLEEVYIRCVSKTLEFRSWIEKATFFENDLPVWHSIPSKSSYIILFLKHFDVVEQKLSGAGHIYVRKLDKISDLASHITNMMGWPASTPLLLFEVCYKMDILGTTADVLKEIKPAMIDSIKPRLTYHQAEIQDGDIICFQKNYSQNEIAAFAEEGKRTDVRGHYDFLMNQIRIRFFNKLSRNISDGAFDLALSRKTTYEQLSIKTGEYLKVDPTHIRFWTVHSTTGKPKQSVKRTPNGLLQNILASHFNPISGSHPGADTLFYEILDLSLSEMETKKVVRVTWLTEGMTKEDSYDILVAKNGTVKDLVPLLEKKAKINAEDTRHIRFFETHNHKPHKVLHGDCHVAGITEFVSLYAEKIPEEELNIGENERFVNVIHFNTEPINVHSVPFRFLIKPDEKFKDTKIRLEKRTGIKGKHFEMMKFAIVQRINYSSPIYLSDNDVLFDLIHEGEDYLGLDHPDRNRNSALNRADSIFIK
ncbi:MAG: hypothetical protein M1829_006537 [Trizodia sp. TS-e1964]|nr:MAG: hypothetical protein M1829_006537 [Trizodia sp. TS-e1964]